MYRWVEHTSELELEIEAATELAVFLEALEAFAELVADEREFDSEQRQLEVRGEDLPALLAAWLDELVFLAETQGFVPESACGLELDGGVLHATVQGYSGAPRQLVKAVTLHRRMFSPAGDGWRARLVFDV